MSTESGDFKLNSFDPIDVTMNGNLGLLFVDSRTPGGCDGVTIATETAGNCDDQSMFNFDLEPVGCDSFAAPVEIVCGTGEGDGDSAAVEVFSPWKYALSFTPALLLLLERM